jgi:hypothetical protein
MTDGINPEGYNSDQAKAAYQAKNAVFPTHPLFPVRKRIQEELEAYAREQATLGWPDMPDSYRKRSIRGELHLTVNLPAEFRASAVYQAYYLSLDLRQRKVARANGNQIHILWCPHSTLFV